MVTLENRSACRSIRSSRCSSSAAVTRTACGASPASTAALARSQARRVIAATPPPGVAAWAPAVAGGSTRSATARTIAAPSSSSLATSWPAATFFVEVAPPRREPVDPGLDLVLDPALRARPRIDVRPRVVGQRRQRHLAPARRAWARRRGIEVAIAQHGADHVVAVAEDVGGDLDRLAGHALDRVSGRRRRCGPKFSMTTR